MNRTQQQQKRSHAHSARAHASRNQRTTHRESGAPGSDNQLRQRLTSEAQRPQIDHDRGHEQEAESVALQSEQSLAAHLTAGSTTPPATPIPHAASPPAIKAINKTAINKTGVSQSITPSSAHASREAAKVEPSQPEELQNEENQPHEAKYEFAFAEDGGTALPNEPGDGQAPTQAPGQISANQAARLAALLQGGAPLDAAVRQEMESFFRHNFDAVRVHTTTSAQQLAHEFGVRAFVVGNHIILGRGSYQPHTRHGRRLLAHELTHVIQQQALGNNTLLIQGQPPGQGSSGGPATLPPHVHEVFRDPNQGKTNRLTFNILYVPERKLTEYRDYQKTYPLYRHRGYARRGGGSDPEQLDIWETEYVGSARDGFTKLQSLIYEENGAYIIKPSNAELGRLRRLPGGGTNERVDQRYKEFFGNAEIIFPLLSRPVWNRAGGATLFEVDHRVELMVTGWPEVGYGNRIDNMELLDMLDNSSSGGRVVADVDRQIREYIAALPDTDPDKTLSVTDIKAKYDIYFQRVESLPDSAGGTVAHSWSWDDVRAGNPFDALRTYLEGTTGSRAARTMHIYDLYDPNPNTTGNRAIFSPHPASLDIEKYIGSSQNLVVYRPGGTIRSVTFAMGNDRIRSFSETDGAARGFASGALVRSVVFYREAADPASPVGEVYLESYDTKEKRLVHGDKRDEYRVNLPPFDINTPLRNEAGVPIGVSTNRLRYAGYVPRNHVIKGSRTGLRFGGGAGNDQLRLFHPSAEPTATYTPFSPVYIENIYFDNEGYYTESGFVALSTAELVGAQKALFAPYVAAPIGIVDGDVQLFRQFVAEDFDMPGPITIQQVYLQVSDTPEEGFAIGGQVDFGVSDFATGYLRALIGSESSFKLMGGLVFDTRYFEQAEIHVTYERGQISGEGVLAFGNNLVKGIRSGSITVSYSNAGLEINGVADLDIPGVQQASLRVSYSETDGLMIGGSVYIEDVKFISAGYLDLELHRDASGWRLAGEGNATLDIPGTEAVVIDASYDDGYFHIYGEATSQRFFFDRTENEFSLQGEIRFGVTNKPVIDPGTGPSSEDTAGEPDKTLRYWGGGTLDLIVSPWFQGRATMDFTEQGEIVFIGEIDILQTVDLIERNDLATYELLAGRIVVYFAAIPVGPFLVPLSGAFDYAINASAYYGPGGLRNMHLGMVYSTGPDGELGFTGSADIFMQMGGTLGLTGEVAARGGIVGDGPAGELIDVNVGIGVNIQDIAAVLEGEAIVGVEVEHSSKKPLAVDFTPRFQGGLRGVINLEGVADLKVSILVDWELPILGSVNLDVPLAGFGAEQEPMTTKTPQTLHGQIGGLTIAPDAFDYPVPDNETEFSDVGENIYHTVRSDDFARTGNETGFSPTHQPSTTSASDVTGAQSQLEQTQAEIAEENRLDRERRIAEGEEILGPGDVPPEGLPTLQVYLPSGSTPIASYDFKAQGGSGQIDVTGDNQIPGYEVRRVGYSPDSRSEELGYLTGIPFGRLRGSLLSPPGDTITLSVARRDPNPTNSDYGLGELQIGDIALFPLTLDKLGPIELNSITIDDYGMLASGMVKPVPPLLAADVPIGLQGDTLTINTTLSGASAFLLPGATIGNPANIHIQFDQTGMFLLDDSRIAFELPGIADGEVLPIGGPQAQFAMTGHLNFDAAVFDPATLPLTVDSRGTFANGTLRLRAEEIADIDDAHLIVAYEEDGLEALGPADIAVPFTVSNVIQMKYSLSDQGLQFTGHLNLVGAQIPGISRGDLNIDTLWRKGRPLQLTGSGSANPNIPGVDPASIMKVHYEAGTLMISASLAYHWGAVSGALAITIVNRPVDALGNVGSPPDDIMRIAIHDVEGLAVVVMPWLNGLTHLFVPGRSLTELEGQSSPIIQSDFTGVTLRQPMELGVGKKPAASIFIPRVTSVVSPAFGAFAIDWTGQLFIMPPRGLSPDIRILYNPLDSDGSGVQGTVLMETPFIIYSKPHDVIYSQSGFLRKDTLELIGVPEFFPGIGSTYSTTQDFRVYWTAKDFAPVNAAPSAGPQPSSPVLVRELHTHVTTIPVGLLTTIDIIEREEFPPFPIHTPALGWEGTWFYGQQGNQYPITLENVTFLQTA